MRGWGAVVAVWAVLSSAGAARAHPLGNMAVSHYTRLTAEADQMRLRFVVDMAEVPTATELKIVDRNHDGRTSEAERAAYAASHAESLRDSLALTLGGARAKLHVISSRMSVVPGAGNLPTLRLVIDYRAELPKRGLPYPVFYQDNTYPDRYGWQEIVAAAGRGVHLAQCTASTTDYSHELTAYPPLPSVPQDTEARFTVAAGAAPAPAAAPILPPDEEMPAPLPAPARASTPRDPFTEWIGRRELTPGLMLAGLLVAFGFGALHALSPGHGKTLVAAYLVGSRGTLRHAVLLGLTVTITHTLGVFALGFVALAASHSVVPERLYWILSLVSSVAVCAVGGYLLVARVRALRAGTPDPLPFPAEHGHAHGQAYHEHAHGEDAHGHVHGEDAHPYEHRHPDHSHAHTGEHEHDTHGHAHTGEHEHDGHRHSHALPEGPVTTRALVALGISGGIVPCPSALVALLAAVALRRIGYGILFITSFSVGLATVLVLIGLLVVSANRRFDRYLSRGIAFRRLPVASAALICLIGIGLLASTLRQAMP